MLIDDLTDLVGRTVLTFPAKRIPHPVNELIMFEPKSETGIYSLNQVAGIEVRIILFENVAQYLLLRGLPVSVSLEF